MQKKKVKYIYIILLNNMKGLGIMDFKAQAQVLFMNFFMKGITLE